MRTRLLAAVLAVAVCLGTAQFSPPASSAAVASDPDRLWGADRYQTAVAVSREFAPGPRTVFLASGQDYPDAVSATAAAGAEGGPVLLTPRAALPDVVAAEIRRLAPQRVVVLGGKTVVSDAVLSKVRSVASNVQRVAGADRYETSRLISKSSFTAATTVMLATGRDYADALVAGAAAGQKKAPTLLVDGRSAKIDSSTLAELKRLGADRIVIAGGHGSISIRIEQQLRTLGFDVQRDGGASRYETAAQLMAHSGPTNPTRIYLASGLDFPDALSVAALAARDGAALYLTRRECVPTIPQRAIADLPQSSRIAVGGVAVVGAGALRNVGCGDVVPSNPSFTTSGITFSTQAAAPYSDRPPVDVRAADQKVDSTGLRIVNMGPGGSRVDHPVAYAQYGLSALLEYQRTGERIWLDRALRQAQRLEQIHTERDTAWYFPYLFDWTYPGRTLHQPWWSAMAQGEALSLFVRLNTETGDQHWRDAAEHTWLSLKQPRSASEPWSTMTDSGLLVFEEYAGDAPPLKVYNGHMFAIFGVYDYWRLTGDETAAKYLDGAATTTLRVFNSIRVPGGVSYYCWQTACRKPAWQNPTYHVIHSWELDTLARLTGDRRFSDDAALLRKDWAPPVTRSLSRQSPDAVMSDDALTTGVVDPPQ